MSAFNILNVKLIEEGKEIVYRLQFKYGDVWQHEYKIGDTLKWDANNYGQKDANKVVVDAVNEDSRKEIDYYITIVNNVITDAQPNLGYFDFGKHGDTFIIQST